MDVGTILLLTMAALFLLALVGMVFSAPLRLAGKALLNTLLGLGTLILLNATSAFTGLSLGVNLFMEDFPNRPALVGGVLEEECRQVLTKFFQSLRRRTPEI